MTLPPRGDPRRDLVRAADEARSLGMLMIGVGVLAGTCFLGNATAAPRGGSASAAQLLGFILFCGASGVFYVHASRDVRRGKGWAPTAILAVVGAQAASVIGFLAWDVLRRSGAAAALLIAPALLWLTAAGIVAFYAARAARAIRRFSLDGASGFDVSVVAPSPASPERPIPVTQDVNREEQVRDGVRDDARAEALRVDEQRPDHQRPHD